MLKKEPYNRIKEDEIEEIKETKFELKVPDRENDVYKNQIISFLKGLYYYHSFWDPLY